MSQSYKLILIFLINIFIINFIINNSYANICIGNAVNVRKSESKTAEIVGKLNTNEPINLLGISGEWIKISKNEIIGFVLNDFIKLTENATINATNVNIRREANSGAVIITKLNTPTRIGIDGVKGDWYSFKFNGTKVWINKSFVTLDEGTYKLFDLQIEDNKIISEVKEDTAPIEVSTNKFGKVTGTNINVRIAANTTAKILGKLNTGNEVEIISQEGNWYAISYNNSTAYISKDFVKVEDKSSEVKVESYVEINESPVPEAGSAHMYVNAYTGLNFRKEPNASSTILSKLSFKTKVEIIEDGKEWCKIKLENGETGYLSKTFLVSDVNELNYSSLDELRQKVVEYAKRYLGTRYVYGGLSFTTGVDCSGFTFLVMKNFGIELNRSSRDQALNGIAISKSDLLQGDLLFFSTATVISHVGLYIGDNKMIHASTPQTGVIISDLASDYNLRTYRYARRVIY